jgi:hypothetical protein
MSTYRAATIDEQLHYQGDGSDELVLVNDDPVRGSVVVEYSMLSSEIALIVDGGRVAIERDAIPALVEQLLAGWVESDGGSGAACAEQALMPALMRAWERYAADNSGSGA